MTGISKPQKKARDTLPSVSLAIDVFRKYVYDFFIFFLPMPAKPTNPVPSNNMVAGSGTGAGAVVFTPISWLCASRYSFEDRFTATIFQALR